MASKSSLATLIESAIGILSMRLINKAEDHNIPDVGGDIRKRLLVLQSAINAAPFEKRTSEEVIEKLSVILKSVEITCAPEFIVFVGRKYPRILLELQKDEVIGRRIKHIFRVAEIGSCFSSRSVSQLNEGIDRVRKRVFEMSESGDE